MIFVSFEWIATFLLLRIQSGRKHSDKCFSNAKKLNDKENSQLSIVRHQIFSIFTMLTLKNQHIILDITQRLNVDDLCCKSFKFITFRMKFLTSYCLLKRNIKKLRDLL